MKKLQGADRAVFALFSNLDESNDSLRGLYEGRLRSRVRDVEGIKRKWEELTGQPVPKKLKTDEFQSQTAAVKSTANTTKPAKVASKPAINPVESTKPATTTAITETAESISADVNSLSYNDIRKQLKDRSISCVGKKPELVERLVNAKMKELMREETKRKKEILFGKENVSNGKEMNNEGQKDNVVAGVNVEKESGVTNQKTDDVEMVDAEKEAPVDQKATITAASPAAAVKPAPKSALKPSKFALAKAKAASPAKFKLAKFESKEAKAHSAAKELLPVNTTIPPKEKISSGSESSKSNSSASAVSKASSVSGASNAPNPAVVQTTPSVKTSSSAKVDSGAKALEKKKDIMASKESRAAKIAEMRERVKNTKAITSSATKTYPSTSTVTSSSASLKSTTKPVPGSETKTNPLIAKMREKAAAEKAGAPPNSTLTALPKPTVASADPVSSFKPSTPQIKSSPPKPRHSSLKSKALKQMMDPANKAPLKKEEKPLSPMQTYEMSDREEESSSDEDSDVESVDKPKKAIPDWAQRSNLQRALILQFEDGPNRLDPDKIFGEVETCNLEQIFGDIKSKKRYHKRTSSGNWTKDHVTIAEKLAYKRTMGYNQS